MSTVWGSLREHVDLENFISNTIRDKFVSKLKTSREFEYVDKTTTALVDAEFVLTVASFGFTNRGNDKSKLKGKFPYLFVIAKLVLDPPYVMSESERQEAPWIWPAPENTQKNPIVWSSFWVDGESDRQLADFSLRSVNKFVKNPEKVKEGFSSAAKVSCDRIFAEIDKTFFSTRIQSSTERSSTTITEINHAPLNIEEMKEDTLSKDMALQILYAEADKTGLTKAYERVDIEILDWEVDDNKVKATIRVMGFSGESGKARGKTGAVIFEKSDTEWIVRDVTPVK